MLKAVRNFSCILQASAALTWLVRQSQKRSQKKSNKIQRKKKVNFVEYVLCLPFGRKEPNRRWCKAERRCSCVRTGTCPTPRTRQRPPRTRFPRSLRSLRGTTELTLPGDRLRTPPGRHSNTAGNPAGGKTSPSPRRKPKQGKNK